MWLLRILISVASMLTIIVAMAGSQEQEYAKASDMAVRKLILIASPESGADLVGNGEYREGNTVRIKALVQIDFELVNWTDESGTVVSDSASFSYVMPGRDVTLTANLRYAPDGPEEPDPAAVKRQVTLVANPVNAGVLSGQGMFARGETVNVKAVAARDYVLVDWRDEDGNLLSEEKEFSYIMPDRKVTLTANFKYAPDSPEEPDVPAKRRLLSFESNPPGIAEFSGSGEYAEGDTVEIKAVVSKDYVLVNWTDERGNEVGRSETFDFIMPARRTILTAHMRYVPESPVEPDYPEVDNSRVLKPRIGMFDSTHVMMLCQTEGAKIRYIYGNESEIGDKKPDSNSSLYSSPFQINGNLTVRAIALKDGMTDSPVAEYHVEAFTMPAPSASVYHRALYLDCEDPKAKIRYIIDDNEEWKYYNGPIELTRDCVVRSVAERDGFVDSKEYRYEFHIADYQEQKPVVNKDFRNRRLTVTHPEGLDVEVSLTGVPVIFKTPVSFDVNEDMARITARALTERDSRYDSAPVVDTLRFHSAPVLAFNGKSVYCTKNVVDPEPEGAYMKVWFEETSRYSGQGEPRIDIFSFGKLTAFVESDKAFRSIVSEMMIDCFNTGKRVAARNGHSLEEVFDKDSLGIYKYLRIEGEIDKDDLKFLGTLPELKTLQLAPVIMPYEDCDSVFYGSRIETLYSPSFPNGMLKGMKRLTSVMWGNERSRMPEGRVAEAENPNILVWVPDKSLAPRDCMNIVTYTHTYDGTPTDPDGPGIVGHADSIQFYTGYPFNTHMPVKVDYIETVKKFSQPTLPGECQGWETVCFPYSPYAIVLKNRFQIVPFSEWDGTRTGPKPFWLYRAVPEGWERSSVIEAGVPYIISMPNNPNYIDYFNIEGDVIFRTWDITLNQSDTYVRSSEWRDGMMLESTFMPVEENGLLSLNVNGEGSGLRQGSAFIQEATTLPFGAYVRGAGNQKRVPVFDDTADVPLLSGFQGELVVETPAPGTLRLSAAANVDIAVYASTGVTVFVRHLTSGETVEIDGLSPGLYIVGGSKIIVK